MKIITRPSARVSVRAARGQGLTLRWGRHPFATGNAFVAAHIVVALSDEGLCWLGLDCNRARLQRDWPGATLIEDERSTAPVAAEIAALWPAGLARLTVPVVLYGTPFQIKVWQALLGIKPGTVVTYGDIAQKIGAPAAVRAVGTAVGRNPVSIVVPCHRVVNKDGSTVNYGWGPALKKMLLKGEGVVD